MNNKKNLFAKENWRKFEILTSILFELEFPIKKGQIIVTPMSKDGGRDIEINTEFISKVLKFPKIEIWVEAKLRNNTKINLGDIGGNVIIASNSNIRSIFFVTNCFFTPQTIRELIVFREKSGLDISLIDGCQYYKLLQEHQKALGKYLENKKNSISNATELKEFSVTLLKSLPKKSKFSINEYEVNIEKGKPIPSSKYNEINKEEIKIETRKIDTSSLKHSSKILKLAEIKWMPAVSDEQINRNPVLQLIGNKRKNLLQETLYHLLRNETVVIKGTSGQGKSFFANYVARELYKEHYYVLFSDALNNNVLSFTKNIITNLISIDYFQCLEDEELIVDYFKKYFNIDDFVARKILELLQKDRFSEDIPVEYCIEILLRIMRNWGARKKILLIVDNLHKSTIDLVIFLKTLFSMLNEASIPVLSLTIHKAKEGGISENQWLHHLDSIIDNNKFKSLTLSEIDNDDIEYFIKALVPGANDNLIRFIKNNTLENPFYIKLYIDFLKEKKVIKSIDGNFWSLDDTAVLLDSKDLRCNSIDTLILNILKIKLENSKLKKIAITLFLFNNCIKTETIERILGDVNIEEVISSNLFHTDLENDSLVLKFSHDLFYNNIVNALTSPKEELHYHSLKILTTFNNERLLSSLQRLDVLGILYEYSGNYRESHINYLKYAESQYKIDSFRSLLYYERALDLLLKNPEVNNEISNANDYTVNIIFKILTLYKKYNFLSARKAPNLFLLLKKYEDFRQLSIVQLTNYYYFLGVKQTRDENFNEAKTFLQKAYDYVDNHTDLPKEIADNVIVGYGINLKHIGERQKSLDFFETAFKRWKTDKIRHEQYANIAAYYLTSKPETSLHYYELMNKKFANRNLHLIIDLAMANFYLNKVDIALQYLNDAILLSKKRMNLSEEARADNIMGIIYWNKNNTLLAESNLDLALSNGELANNHRWIWRIRTNLAQIALINQKMGKAYNICWMVIDHLLKTKEAMIFEVRNPNIHSRRFASLKAVLSVLYKMNKIKDINKIEQSFAFSEVSTFIKELILTKTLLFDAKDSNLFNNANYYILG